MLMAKLLSGPATVFVSQPGNGWPGLGLTTPGAQICGPFLTGNGRKSDAAVGIGLELFGLLLAVNPVNPVSSPVILPWTNDWSGSSNRPKVLCGTPLAGSMPKEYWLNTATE